MFALLLFLATTPPQTILHCRAVGEDLPATKEFTLVESESKVLYSVATGIAEVRASFSANEVSFPDNWPKSFKGGYVIDRRALTYRRLVTYDGKTVVNEAGSCSLYAPPPDVPASMRGARPPQD